MIHVAVLHNFNNSCLVNIVQVYGGQNVLLYVPEYKVNKPFLQLSIFKKAPNRSYFTLYAIIRLPLVFQMMNYEKGSCHLFG